MVSARTVSTAAELAPSVAEVLRQQPALLVVDFDGTLSPIVSDPASARVLPAARVGLRRLREHLACVAVVTGRPIQDVRKRLRIGGLAYIGNHGIETWQRGRVVIHPEAAPLLPAMRRTVDLLASTLGMNGVHVEDKGATASIHYRNAADPDAARRMILDCIQRYVDQSALRVEEGRMVVNLLPRPNITKGTAVDRLVELVVPNGVVVFGDDVTDTHAFQVVRTLRERESIAGLTVAVVSAETPGVVWEAADAAVAGVDTAADLLSRVADLLSAQR